jgi:hypothetical protein
VEVHQDRDGLRSPLLDPLEVPDPLGPQLPRPVRGVDATTFTPASRSWAMRSGCGQAGPRVATILVRRMVEPGTDASTMGVGDSNGRGQGGGGRGQGRGQGRMLSSYPHPSSQPEPSARN